jgi:Na+-transporting NADH:ubiquinone oxidoreductase subunit C
MSAEATRKAILVVAVTALVCSGLVSAAVVILRPIQLNNQLLDRSRNIMQLTGLLPSGQSIEDDDMLELFRSLDMRIVNIDAADFDSEMDAGTFDKRLALNDPELSVAIIALEADLNTISGMTFYEQNETPGLGGQIVHEHWLEQWQQRRVYDYEGNPRFRVAEGTVEPGSPASDYEVDALTGATVTGNAVTSLMHYWFGPHGYQPFLSAMRQHPPQKPAELEP